MSGLPLTFVSSLRRGFVAQAGQTTDVSVTVGSTAPIARTLDVLGPGDATGIDPRQVIRCSPAAGATDVESNYLALVEFDRPDLPWMFSPAPVGGRLVPWMMLVVVDVTDGADPIEPGKLRPQLTAAPEELGDPTEAWLWAHAQVLGTDATDPDRDPSRSLSRLLCPRRLEPQRRYLACVVPTFAAGVRAGLGGSVPDELRVSTEPAWTAAQDRVTLPVYHQFRFSTGPAGDFEQLVRRLRGVPLPEELGRRRLTLDHARSDLPVPEPAGAVVELHAALRPPGATLAPIGSLTGESYLDALRRRLSDAGYDIGLLGERQPRVGPPVYGQFPAGVRSTDPATSGRPVPPWLAELNGDPRHRVAAGLGTLVVQRNQERYVAEAWRQVDQVLAANRLRRRGEFAVAVSATLFTRWLDRLDPLELVATTSPTHGRVKLDGRAQTIAGRLRASPVAPEVVSVEFRRFTRVRGHRRHGLGSIGLDLAGLAARLTEAEPLVSRVELDTIGRFEPPTRVWGPARSAEIYAALVPGAPPADAAARLDQIAQRVQVVVPPTAELVAALERTSVDRVLTAVGMLPTKLVTDAVAPPVVTPPPGPRPRPRDPRLPPVVFPRPRPPLVPPVVLPPVFRPRFTPIERAKPLGLGRFGRLDPVVIRRLPPADLAPVLTDWRDSGVIVAEPGGRVVIDAVALDRSSRVGAAVVTIDAGTAAQIVSGTFRPPKVSTVDFGLSEPVRIGVRDELAAAVAAIGDRIIRDADRIPRPGDALRTGVTELDGVLRRELRPERSIQRMIGHLVSGLPAGLETNFDPIMAAPELSEPTYRELARISHDWILPGLDDLPPDTTTLAAANRRFIASFLVGMNHELGRELLWREYPTDQRGSFSRQFWVHRLTGAADDQYDLRRPLHRAGGLDLAGLTGGAGEDPLVLIVKGQLIRRYPGLIVNAGRTKLVDGRRVMDPTRVIEPDFFGVLEPDVLFVGFDELTASGVRAAAGDPDQAVWMFFAEHFAEPRFGLDEPDAGGPGTLAVWNDATWGHVGANGHLAAASLTRSLPKRAGDPAVYRWGHDSADQAWITLQFPFRRGIPAATLLPPVSP